MAKMTMLVLILHVDMSTMPEEAVQYMKFLQHSDQCEHLLGFFGVEIIQIVPRSFAAEQVFSLPYSGPEI
jgi:hypothetical protein